MLSSILKNPFKVGIILLAIGSAMIVASAIIPHTADNEALDKLLFFSGSILGIGSGCLVLLTQAQANEQTQQGKES